MYHNTQGELETCITKTQGGPIFAIRKKSLPTMWQNWPPQRGMQIHRYHLSVLLEEGAQRGGVFKEEGNTVPEETVNWFHYERANTDCLQHSTSQSHSATLADKEQTILLCG